MMGRACGGDGADEKEKRGEEVQGLDSKARSVVSWATKGIGPKLLVEGVIVELVLVNL